MLASACSALSRAAESTDTPGVPDPATAILLSVPSDTVYMVDPDSGAVAVVASDLTDFQAGYAAWAPNHSRYAYGQAGIDVTRPGSNNVVPVVKGQLISMPSWSPNGKQIVYGNGAAMYIKTLGHSGPDRVFLPRTLAPFSFDWGQGNTIAFEGLALSCEGTPTCMSANNSDIFTIHSDGSGLHRLTKVATATNPKWSADFTPVRSHRGKEEEREAPAVDRQAQRFRHATAGRREQRGVRRLVARRQAACRGPHRRRRGQQSAAPGVGRQCRRNRHAPGSGRDLGRRRVGRLVTPTKN
jgi:hypothetical protein